MSFKTSQDECLEYVRLDSEDHRRRVKIFLNNAVKKFLDIRYWEKCMFVEDITINGSDTYDLTALLLNPIYRIKSVYQVPSETTELYTSQMSPPWSNVGIEYYERALSKNNIYAVLKDTLYVSGTGFTLRVEYLSAGTGYPMSADADNPVVIQNYADIIEKWAEVLFLKWWGEIDVLPMEMQELNELIVARKKDEAREAKRGRSVTISAHNRG